MEKSTPIKRHESLKQLSREHHHGLLLCWKIKEGLKANIAPERIKKYADWFWEAHLATHFEMEEKHIFSILPANNELIKRAIAEHKSLNQLFHTETELLKTLEKIEKELESHIRFEERILFNEIQKHATEEQLETIQKLHVEENFEDNVSDPFWIK
ncbi:hemerythrin domain-containing protein [Flavobacterium taihuense]|uniref:Hemerythrin domain-containing protein n=1 Tax=Flavobacterium taihuense TaxID=2857508 RepID=A0ABS6XSS0_9FLAO|nr:hemerythrin domain-containing protein [Flavobacterium taihuense]MBW4359664.1 hemerythrin domain-containing protein [Flavobacterium taihuense]